ncbi:MAG: hypothetical protein AABO41_18720 [Acidobacteriota bacterium]
MKYRGLLLLAVGVLTFGSLATAQSSQEFADKEGKFKLTLSGEWKPVTYSDAVGRQKTEFVYRDRSEGLLKISKETLAGSLADLIRQEEENLKIYRSGFEGASREPFGGGPLSGIRLSFYTVDSGRRAANTYYYLQDKNAVWVLRFTGKRGSLDTIRNLTDQIARSFQSL